MKRNRMLLPVLAAVLGASACLIEPSVKVIIEIPGTAAVRLDPYREILITGFWQEKETKDFDLNKELTGFLLDEIEHQFKGKLSSKAIAWPTAEAVQDKDFWRRALENPEGRLILTGQAQFSQDIRKAPSAASRRSLDDGPFTPEKAWEERKNFALKLDIYLIRPDSGEILFEKEFQESMDYENKRQSAEFAFNDLLRRVRLTLLRLLFGSGKIQERYLLSK